MLEFGQANSGTWLQRQDKTIGVGATVGAKVGVGTGVVVGTGVAVGTGVGGAGVRLGQGVPARQYLVRIDLRSS